MSKNSLLVVIFNLHNGLENIKAVHKNGNIIEKLSDRGLQILHIDPYTSLKLGVIGLYGVLENDFDWREGESYFGFCENPDVTMAEKLNTSYKLPTFSQVCNLHNNLIPHTFYGDLLNNNLKTFASLDEANVIVYVDGATPEMLNGLERQSNMLFLIDSKSTLEAPDNTKIDIDISSLSSVVSVMRGILGDTAKVFLKKQSRNVHEASRIWDAQTISGKFADVPSFGASDAAKN